MSLGSISQGGDLMGVDMDNSRMLKRVEEENDELSNH